MDDFIAELRSGRDWLNDGKCCGQVCSDGVCCAPACVFGEALKYFYKAADMLEAQEKRIAELTGNREAWKGIQEGTAKILKEKEVRIAELEAENRALRNEYKAVNQELTEMQGKYETASAALEKKND